MPTLAQRWCNVELATVSLRWPNGQNYIAPTSQIYVGPTVPSTLGQRWANVVVLSGGGTSSTHLRRTEVIYLISLGIPVFTILVIGECPVLHVYMPG